MRRGRAWLPMALAVFLSGCFGTGDNGGDGEPAEGFHHVHGLAIDPNDDAILYVGTHAGVVIGRDDTDWRYSGHDRSDFMGLTTDPSRSGVLYSSGHDLQGRMQGVRKSITAGGSWQTLALANAADCHGLTVSPVVDTTLYCAHSGGDFWRSQDGATFEKVAPFGLRPPVYALAASPRDASALFAATKAGVQVSRDGGANWTHLVGEVGRTATAVATHPRDESVLWASFQGTQGPRMAKSTNAGAAWAESGQGIPSTDTVVALAVSRQTPDLLYAAGVEGIYKSLDGGQSWTTVKSIG